MDRCVQRLRKRIVSESWAKKRNNSGNVSTGKMGNRVPSFFTSPSLVNLSGLGVSDQTKLEQFQVDPADMMNGNGNHEQYQKPELRDPSRANGYSQQPAAEPYLPTSEGWGGLGLRGNRSSASLNRTASVSSGIFIDGEEDPSSQVPSVPGSQEPGEVSKVPSDGRLNKLTAAQEGYYKTTNMACFYYRKSLSYSEIRKSTSAQNMVDGSPVAKESKRHSRKRSQSQGDLKKIWANGPTAL